MEKSIPGRMETIEKIVKDKDVIHFGCADHLEIIEAKIAKDIWFHKRLMGCARRCVGVDNNKRAVEFLQEKLKIPDVYYLDILNDNIPTNWPVNNFDYLVLGEIIEHVDNPVLFLQVLHQKFQGFANRMIITTPHAFRWSNFWQAAKHNEVINSDHRYWFTAYTLSKVLYQAGFREIDFMFVENSKPSKLALRKNILYRLFPMFRDTIIITTRF